jgi:hypothetical protein
LEKGKKYTATIYADAKMRIIKQTRKPMLFVVVTNKSKLSQLSAPGGGYAVSIIEIKKVIRLKTSQTIYESQQISKFISL